MRDPRYLTEMPDPPMHEVMSGHLGQSMDGYREVCCLSAAMDLNLFEMMTSGRTSEEVGGELGTDSVLLRPLLDILTGMGLLTRDGDRYTVSRTARVYLTDGSPYCQKERFRSVLKRLDGWNRIADRIMGEYADDDGFDPVPWIVNIGQNAMSGDIQETLAFLRGAVDLSGCRTLLDVGGGHGLYSIAFSHAYPGLRCTVFDRPEITPVTRRNAEEYGTEIGIQEGDYYEVGFDGSFDIVFISYNMAAMDPELTGRVSAAVNPGGYVIIRHSVLTGDSPFDFVEWNSRSAKGGRRRPEFSEYLDSAREHGLEVMLTERLKGHTELVVLRKRSD